MNEALGQLVIRGSHTENLYSSALSLHHPHPSFQYHVPELFLLYSIINAFSFANVI
jgi:hypothetical protein